MEDVWQICSCLEQRRVERLMSASQITDKFRAKTFKNFYWKDRPDEVRKAFEKAFVYMQQFEEIRNSEKNSICLCGQPGSGKTHLLMAIANGLLDKGVEVLYVPFVETMEQVKEDMKKEDVNKERFEKMKQVEVLFVDDLFKIEPTDYERRKVYEVINYRYLEQKPLLITSEHSMPELVHFDEAIGSRIYEMCEKFYVLMRGEGLNYRLKNIQGVV